MPAGPAGLPAPGTENAALVPGRAALANELLGFCVALGNVGLFGLNLGASVLPTALASGFLCHQLHDGPLVQPLTPINKSVTTATRPVVARMAKNL
jgi:hypothetical protein